MPVVTEPDDSFESKVRKFNEMYKLPLPNVPTLPTSKELINFKAIIKEELEEIDLIIDKMQNWGWDQGGTLTDDQKLEILTDLVDWHGDCIVYFNTNAARLGLPLRDGLHAIMDSNFSKLGADGKPIYHSVTGKVLKGPNFFPPEPRIKEIIRARFLSYSP